VHSRIQAAGLADIDGKLQSEERLSFEDGVRLFACPDLLVVGWLANREREKRHGARTFFNHNLRLEPTNVCVASCLFCSFARLKPTDSAAYTMSLEQAWDKLRQRAHQPITELHIVNGLNPDLPFSYYTDLLRGFKRIRPAVHLKCFTAVEIAFFADLYRMSDEQVLRELMDAGLESLPGGGAEIFAERVSERSVTTSAAPIAISTSTAPRIVSAQDQCNDALRAYRDAGGARRSHAARAGAAG
jgi:aminodeoxyfutalosine synthase